MPPSVQRLPRSLGSEPVKLLRLHPLERALLTVFALHLIFLPWAAGGMKLWTQWISLGLALVSFSLALIPRRYTEEHTGSSPFTLYPWRRLLRFPLFWLGLIFAAYMAIGALNPGWRYVIENNRWWMTRVAHIEWLPHGVTDVPMAWGSPWRSLIVFPAAFFLTCALWMGLTRRRTLEILLVTLSINALFVAIFALIGRGTHMTKLYWTWFAYGNPFGPFIYHNHAAAWLNLMLCTTVGLAVFLHHRATRQMRKSSPGLLFAFFALGLAAALVASLSRGGVLVALVVAVIALGWTMVSWLRRPASGRSRWVTVLFALVLVGFGAFAVVTTSGRQLWARFQRIDSDTSYATRLDATAATMDMWRAAPWLGSGACSFRYVFPLYQQHYSSIYEKKMGRKIRRYTWEYAHNDWAQMLAEYGVIGSGLALLALAWWLVAFFRSHGWAQPTPFALGLALLATLLHARGDFVFHCPAVLLTCAALAIVGLRWAELSTGRRG